MGETYALPRVRGNSSFEIAAAKRTIVIRLKSYIRHPQQASAHDMEYNQDLAKGRMPVYCWGHKDLPKQKGVVTYRLSPNQFSLTSILYKPGAVSNTFRRTRNQFIYVVPPLVGAYMLMEWANDRNRYLNSKKGRREAGGA